MVCKYGNYETSENFPFRIVMNDIGSVCFLLLFSRNYSHSTHRMENHTHLRLAHLNCGNSKQMNRGKYAT